MALSRVEVENQIKERADVSWLTPSQASVARDLELFLGGPHRVINLYGPHGAGKTFLAHVLCKAGRCDYLPSAQSLRRSELPLVIDNAPSDRSSGRAVRNVMRLHSLSQLLLVTVEKVDDSIPAFQLSPTRSDIDFIRANLFRHLDVRLPDCGSMNMWDHLKLIGGSQ